MTNCGTKAILGHSLRGATSRQSAARANSANQRPGSTQRAGDVCGALESLTRRGSPVLIQAFVPPVSWLGIY